MFAVAFTGNLTPLVKRADESPMVGHKDLAVSIAANYVSGTVIGCIVNYSRKSFYRYDIVYFVACAADYLAVQNGNSLDMVGLVILYVILYLSFGFRIKLRGEFISDRSKISVRPGILEPYVEIGSVVEEFFLAEILIPGFELFDIVGERLRGLRLLDGDGTAGVLIRHSGFAEDSADDYYDDDDTDYKHERKIAAFAFAGITAAVIYGIIEIVAIFFYFQ